MILLFVAKNIYCIFNFSTAFEINMQKNQIYYFHQKKFGKFDANLPIYCFCLKNIWEPYLLYMLLLLEVLHFFVAFLLLYVVGLFYAYIDTYLDGKSMLHEKSKVVSLHLSQQLNALLHMLFATSKLTIKMLPK